MRRKLQTVLGVMLCLALLLSMVPVSVQAETTAEQPEYYGRSALAALDNSVALLYAYDQIVAGVEAVSAEITVYDGVNPLSEDELKMVLDVYIRDYTHHFWLDNKYRYSANSTTVKKLVPQYLMTGETLEAAKLEFEAAADEILAGITSDMTEYEKELYLHDAVAEFAYYSEGTNAHNAYGALVEGVTVCEGYAEALQYLLRRAGIQSFIVIGTGNGGAHAWNMVRIDGNYYHVDLTWNDGDDTIYYSYFNVTDKMILADHTINATAYALPQCISTDAFYYNVSGTYLESYTIESVAKLLQDNELRIQAYVPGDMGTLIEWYYDNIGAIAAAAGVRTGFSYGCRYLDNEVELYITHVGVKLTSDQSVSYYDTLTNALSYSADGAALKLLNDLTESFNTSRQLTLDLNGYDINGSVTAANMVIYDSQTDDYTVNNGNGYGVISGTVTGAAMEGYAAITENDGTSFHKVDIAIKSLTLKAGSVGLYYTGSFNYDEVVAGNATCGTVLSAKNAEPVADDSDASCLYTTTANSVLLKNIMSEGNTEAANLANARKMIYGRAYLKLNDGTFLYSDVTASNLQTMVETVDAKALPLLSETQRDILAEMYQTYSEEMSSWNIPNLKAA